MGLHEIIKIGELICTISELEAKCDRLRSHVQYLKNEAEYYRLKANLKEEKKLNPYCVNCGHTEREIPEFARQPTSKLRCQFCKGFSIPQEIYKSHKGINYCSHCGRKFGDNL